MRVPGAIFIVVATAFFVPAKAAEPQWCAVWGDGARNCSYDTLERCQQATSGAAGKCEQGTSTAAARPAKATSAPDDQLDKLLDKVNKKSDSLLLCRGC